MIKENCLRFAIEGEKGFLSEGLLDLPHLSDARVREISRIRFDSSIGHMNIALFRAPEEAEDYLAKVRDTLPHGSFATEKVVPVVVEVRQVTDEKVEEWSKLGHEISFCRLQYFRDRCLETDNSGSRRKRMHGAVGSRSVEYGRRFWEEAPLRRKLLLDQNVANQ